MFEMFVNREIQHICLPKALCAKRVSCYRGDRLSYQRGLRKCDESQSIARGRVKRLFAQLMWLDPVSSLSDSRTWLRHAKFWFDLDFLCMVNSRRSSMLFAFHIFHSPKRATWFCAHARHTDINAWFDESSKCEWTSQVESNIFFDPCIILFFDPLPIHPWDSAQWTSWGRFAWTWCVLNAMNIQSFACDWPESIPESSRVSEKGCFNVIQAHLFCLADSLANFTRTWKPSGSLIQSFATRLQGSVYRAKDWSQIVVMLLLDACRLDFSPFCRTFDVDNVDSLWCKARLEVMQNFWRFHAVVAEFLLVTSYRSNTSAILRCWLVGLWQMACAISGHPCIREIISWRAASLGRGISPQADVDPMPHSWPKAINKSFQPEPKLAHEITLNMLSSFPIASPLLNWSTGLCITIEGFESLRRRCWACMLGGECQDVQGKSKGNSGPCRIFKKGKLSSDRKNRHIDLVTKRNDLCLSRQMIFFFWFCDPREAESLALYQEPVRQRETRETVSCTNLLVVKLPACLF